MEVSVGTLCGLGGCNFLDGAARLCDAKAIVHKRLRLVKSVDIVDICCSEE